MELRNLKTFTVVADTGSVAAAAKQLHCVQSNVTVRIKSLEAELGVKLFNRSRSGMSLTSAGSSLLPYAQEVIRAEKRALASVEAFSTTVKHLRIGSMESTMAVRLPEILSSFRANYPDLRLNLTSGPTEALIDQLLHDQIDLAIVGGKFEHPKLKASPLFAEEMVMLSARDQENVEELRSMPIMVFRQGCSYRDYTRRWMRSYGLAPNEIYELGTLDGILGCVASGIGITCLPRSVAESYRYKNLLKIHFLEDPERFIDTYALQNQQTVENGAVDMFIKSAKQTIFAY